MSTLFSKFVTALAATCSLVLLWSVAGCAHSAAQTLVLPYAELGPQAASFDLIGNEWYQWNTQGPNDPQAHNDVRVVIYDGMTPAEVRRRFPVSEGRKQDYRYLPLAQALRHLDNLIGSFSAVEELKDGLPRLKATRAKIAARFAVE